MKTERRYAHFHRLLAELMRECLSGEGDGVPGVRVHWVYHHETGPIKHVLRSETEGKNVFSRAFYLISDESLIPDLKRRLSSLEALRSDVLAELNLKKSTELIVPTLYEGVDEVSYSRLDSYTQTKLDYAKARLQLENHLAEYRYFTERYEHSKDEVLDARYHELKRLETFLQTFKDEGRYLLRRPQRRVLPNLRFTNGEVKQVSLPKVGMILSPEPKLIDNTRKKRRSSARQVSPLLDFDGGKLLYRLNDWQAAGA